MENINIIKQKQRNVIHVFISIEQPIVTIFQIGSSSIFQIRHSMFLNDSRNVTST